MLACLVYFLLRLFRLFVASTKSASDLFDSFVPHQLPHAHAIAHEGVPLNVIKRQLGHRNLGVSSIYLHGIDPDERRQPMIPASVGLILPPDR
jgi:integrase/recombinase XerD